MSVRKNGSMGFVDAALDGMGGQRPDGTSTRDKDASFTSKHGVPHHGCKGHIAADLSGIVADYRFGTAKEHDPNHIDDLTLHERTLVLAHSA